MTLVDYQRKCNRCGNPAYLGYSGLDDGTHEQCFAYLCPSCGSEGADFIPDIDDVFPEKTAWERTNKGVRWLVDDIHHVPFDQVYKMIWCDRCRCFVSEKDLKRWTGDDALHYLCPGCDADLLPVGDLE